MRKYEGPIILYKRAYSNNDTGLKSTSGDFKRMPNNTQHLCSEIWIPLIQNYELSKFAVIVRCAEITNRIVRYLDKIVSVSKNVFNRDTKYPKYPTENSVFDLIIIISSVKFLSRNNSYSFIYCHKHYQPVQTKVYHKWWPYHYFLFIFLSKFVEIDNKQGYIFLNRIWMFLHVNDMPRNVQRWLKWSLTWKTTKLTSCH